MALRRAASRARRRRRAYINESATNRMTKTATTIPMIMPVEGRLEFRPPESDAGVEEAVEDTVAETCAWLARVDPDA